MLNLIDFYINYLQNDIEIIDNQAELFSSAFWDDITKISEVLNQKRENIIKQELNEMIEKMDDGEEKEALKAAKPTEHIHQGIKGYLGMV